MPAPARLLLGEEHRGAPEAPPPRPLLDLDVVDEQRRPAVALALGDPQRADTLAAVLDHVDGVLRCREPFRSAASPSPCAPSRARPRVACRRSTRDLGVAGSAALPKAANSSSRMGRRRSCRRRPPPRPGERCRPARGRTPGRRSASRSAEPHARARAPSPAPRCRGPSGSRGGRRRSRRDRRAPLDAGRPQRLEVVEDVRPEPRLTRRRLALEGEAPVVDAGALRDQGGCFEQLVTVRVALSSIRAGSECAVKTTWRSRAAHAVGQQRRRNRARRASSRRSASSARPPSACSSWPR